MRPAAASRLGSEGLRPTAEPPSASRLESAGLRSAGTMSAAGHLGEAAHAQSLRSELASAGELESRPLWSQQTEWNPLEGASELDAQELEAARLEWEKLKAAGSTRGGFKVPDEGSR